jgi:uncharacterized protein (TIGR03067 family)
MHPRVIMLAVAVFTLGFAPAPLPRRDRPRADKGDLEKMQGTWTIVKWRYNERDMGSGEYQVTVTAGHWSFTRVGEGRPRSQWHITVNSAATPRTLDFKQAGDGTSRLDAIYRFEGDNLIVCYTQGEGRPAQFEGKGRSWLMVLKRERK